MRTEVDEIRIDGTREPGHVLVSFADIDLDFDVATARKVARVLMDQADTADLNAMLAKETP